ncbi:MAG: glycosyltransferase [Rhodoblastus sp.]
MTSRRLLFYTHALVGGGAERVWAQLAAGFAARGAEVDFVVDFEAQANMRHLGDKARLTVLPRGHGAATWALARLLRKRRPHASLSAISVSNLKHTAAAMLARRRDRAILSYHGFYESEREKLSNIGYRLTHALTQKTAATIAVSHSLRDDLIARFNVAPDHIVAIFNPAAPDPFPPALSCAELAKRAPLVVAAGRLTHDKNFAGLLRAFAKVETPGAHLRIFGEGEQRNPLLELARSLGLEDRVKLAGYSDNIPDELGQARCFVLSSFKETFGLVCVEALACGLPCVVTQSGGPPEIVSSPELGETVAVDRPDAMAAAIDRALRAPGDPAPRQARARDFSLDAALDHYAEIIARVMSHARSAV